MCASTVEVVEEKRIAERREGWHTPETCFKLLSVQEAMDAVNKQLVENAAHIGRVDEKLTANNSATAEVLEIIIMGKGFFKTVGVLGIAVKWALGIATAVVAFIVALKTGKT